jgi:DNA polymerase-3 subunit gamma/tau
MRDAITLLDQCISVGCGEITSDDVLSVAGRTSGSFIAEIAEALKCADVQKLLGAVDSLVMDGKDITKFVSDLVLYFRNLLICKVSSFPEDIIHVPEQALELMKNQSRDMSREEIIYIIKELSALEASIKWSAQPRVLLEVALIRICNGSISPGSHDLEDRLSALERKVNSICREGAAPRSTKAAPELPAAAAAGKTEKTPDVKPEKPRRSTVPKAVDAKVWNDILNELKNMGRMTIYSNLTGAKPLELDSGSIGIVFPEGRRFNKMFVSTAENIEVLENVISKKLGRKVIVRCLDEEGSPVTEDKADHINSDAFEKARSFAEKFDVPFNIIDE